MIKVCSICQVYNLNPIRYQIHFQTPIGVSFKSSYFCLFHTYCTNIIIIFDLMIKLYLLQYQSHNISELVSHSVYPNDSSP